MVKQTMITDILLFLTGIVVGMMNAVAGGGSLVGFPVLIGFGLAPIVANATSYLTVIPGQISSVFGYRNYLKKVPRLYLLLIIPCVIGAAIGATILKNIAFSQFDRLIPILILLAVLLFAVQPFLHFHLNRHLHGRAKSNWPVLLVGLALLPLAIYGGFFGPGFGFVILAFLGFTKLHEIHKMSAIKNLAAASMAITVVVVIASSGLINWHYGLIIAGGNLIGGYTGARLAQKVPSHWLRVTVIIIGLAIAAYLGVRYR